MNIETGTNFVYTLSLHLVVGLAIFFHFDGFAAWGLLCAYLSLTKTNSVQFSIHNELKKLNNSTKRSSPFVS